ncbi:hypothetical protein HX004_15240 [Myroides sp. 1354]|uniref:hypothetical protein n=1 Tax=unclassified Myroides TaxID=2642485 RepID=UPI0025787FDC|nr:MULTISPECIES: hypothetical protein [unclassified Myroides]MDM1046169.1 hypothetical protein [Myroides sp. R163-1]MDM1057115.1 hypothetical protein [Myroides sp. 1354]MDM1070300.1 hypothetical protein [Myroides sp. 1372]
MERGERREERGERREERGERREERGEKKGVNFLKEVNAIFLNENLTTSQKGKKTKTPKGE